jgi:hypothetical protein
MPRAPRLGDGDFPAVFRGADDSSVRGQRRFLATAVALILVLVAAVMGVLSAPWTGWVGAAACLVAILVGGLAVTQNLERTWYDGRALAESATSLTWLYAAGAATWARKALPMTGSDRGASAPRRTRPTRLCDTRRGIGD